MSRTINSFRFNQGRRRTPALRAVLAVMFVASAPHVQAGGYFDEQSVVKALRPVMPAVWLEAAAETPPASCAPLLQHTFNLLQTGEAQSLCRYQGKVLLIVNTASFCGYTTQYEGLEALYRKYKERGLVVVGFPSNDFGGQEPGTNKEIAEFCRTTYGVQFPLYEKTTVTQLSSNALYGDLAKATGQAPKWNFHKYLIDRDGRAVASFASGVMPDARELTTRLEKLLDAKPAAAKS